MPILNQGRAAAEFVYSEAPRTRSRATVTIASGAGVVEVGTVLGRVTATGKLVPSPDTGADGSQIAVAINLYRVDATAADVKVAVIDADAEVNVNLLRYAASVNDATKRAAKATQLAAVGIKVR